jgi:hypothetical protein
MLGRNEVPILRLIHALFCPSVGGSFGCGTDTSAVSHHAVVDVTLTPFVFLIEHFHKEKGAPSGRSARLASRSGESTGVISAIVSQDATSIAIDSLLSNMATAESIASRTDSCRIFSFVSPC